MMISNVPEAQIPLELTEALVRDPSGQPYIAVYPGYALSQQHHHRAVITRCVASLLSAVAATLSLAGQLLPYLSTTRGSAGVFRTVSVWDTHYAALLLPRQSVHVQQAMQACAVMAATGAAVSTALSVISATTLVQDERQRRAEQQVNDAALRDGRGVAEAVDGAVADAAWPFLDDSGARASATAEMPVERRERRRRQRDCGLTGVAVAALLIACASGATVTVLMCVFDGDASADKLETTLYAGALLTPIAAAYAVVAALLLACQPLAQTHLCCAPPLRQCELLSVDMDVSQLGDKERPPLSGFERVMDVGSPGAGLRGGAVPPLSSASLPESSRMHAPSGGGYDLGGSSFVSLIEDDDSLVVMLLE